ncbi:hypothetical protein GN956_G5038 [Arapaima gigas]
MGGVGPWDPPLIKTRYNQESLCLLKSWVQKTSTKLVQINGQRKYGGPPPGWDGPAPELGCEVYITHIPRNVYADRLITLFQTVGCLCEFRLMMNFSRKNRGFAYVRYDNPTVPAWPSAPCMATSCRRVCIWRQHRKTDITAVIQYASHYAASVAKKVLGEEFKKKFGKTISVKWLMFLLKPKKESKSLRKVLQSPLPGFTQKAPKPCPLPSSRQVVDESLPARCSPFSAVGHPPPLKLVAPPGRELQAVDTVALLQVVCDLFGLGPPKYNMKFCYRGQRGSSALPTR